MTGRVAEAMPRERASTTPAPAMEAEVARIGQAAEAAARDIGTTAQAAVAMIERGTPEFRHIILAMFSAGFATFALLYCVQPLLPVFSDSFHVSAAGSSLALSLTTGLLAVSMLVASAISQAFGRKPIMLASLVASAVLTIVCAAAPSWGSLLVLRALVGITLAGLPAVAMAYVSEEIDPKSIGYAMGLYIGGNGLGGMAGRLLTGIITDLAGWRMAMGAIGVFGVIAAVVFWRMLPPSRHFSPRAMAPGAMLRSFGAHLRDRGMVLLFLEGFLVMGSFVSIYNYIGYRLLLPPFSLSQTVIGLLFSVYLVGIFSSAFMGNLSGRLGRRGVISASLAIMLAGTLLTLTPFIPTIILGVALITFGFFGAHSVASSWVGARAKQGRAQAASLYLLSYYIGSSVLGSLGGMAWEHGQWRGLVTMNSGLLLVALLAAAALWRVKPAPAAT